MAKFDDTLLAIGSDIYDAARDGYKHMKGDKTQIATSLLAAQYSDILLVTIGTTLGMMLANVPAVDFGEAVTKIVPLKYVRIGAAVVFAVIGVWIILAALGVL